MMRIFSADAVQAIKDHFIKNLKDLEVEKNAVFGLNKSPGWIAYSPGVFIPICLL